MSRKVLLLIFVLDSVTDKSVVGWTIILREMILNRMQFLILWHFYPYYKHMFFDLLSSILSSSFGLLQTLFLRHNCSKKSPVIDECWAQHSSLDITGTLDFTNFIELFNFRNWLRKMCSDFSMIILDLNSIERKKLGF